MSQESMPLADSLTNHIVIPSELETSTPISSQRHGKSVPTDLLFESVSEYPLNGSKSSLPSHSILKNKTLFNESLLSYKGNEVPRDAVEHNSSYYSVANDVPGSTALHPAGAHKVFFSPTKEVVSYGLAPNHEFQVNLMHVDRPSKEGGPSMETNQVDTVPLFWARIAVDPRIPYVLLLYLQLFFNAVIVSVVIYLLYTVVRTVRQDVRHKIEMYTADAIQEISLCSRQYYRNRCSNDGTNIRAPALEETCMTLEKCMNRDPQQIGKSQITAETFADILNGFMNPISWKLTVLFTGLIVGGVFIINVAFGTYRSRSGMEDFSKNTNATNSVVKSRKEMVLCPQNGQLLVASTPPNPPLPQDGLRVDDDSTLSFSLPLSSRSVKQGL